MAGGEELAARIEQSAAATEGVQRQAESTGVRYAVAGVPFAFVSRDRAVFRLRPDVAEAALGTPDVRASDLGAGWVELVPAELDRFALDRATSWFAAAARYAAEGALGRLTH